MFTSPSGRFPFSGWFEGTSSTPTSVRSSSVCGPTPEEVSASLSLTSPVMGTVLEISPARQRIPSVGSDSLQNFQELRDSVVKILVEQLIKDMTAKKIQGYDPEGSAKIRRTVQNLVGVSVPGLEWVRHYLLHPSHSEATVDLREVLFQESALHIMHELKERQSRDLGLYEESLKSFFPQ